MNAPETSFFQSGGALLPSAASYVERPSDRELLNAVQAGEFCYVLTSRQMGKSSLMVRTTRLLRAQGVQVAAVDLSGIGSNVTLEQWYDGLLSGLGRQLGLEDELEAFWRAQGRFGPTQRFFRALRDVVLARRRGSVVVFLDEVDLVRSLPFGSDEFFGALKECYTGRAQDPELERLTFCLFGVATPAQLAADPERTPFNLGRRIVLRDFTRAEMAGLSRGLMSEARPDLRLAGAVLDRVFHWTHGQPYLTQQLCRVAGGVIQGRPTAEAQDLSVPAGPAEAAALVDALADRLFLSARARWQDVNLLHVRDRMVKAAAGLPGLIPRYRRILAGRTVRDAADDEVISVLHLAGLVRVEDGRLRLRNRIYATVFDRAWADQVAGEPHRLPRRRLAWAGAAATVLGVIALLLLHQASRRSRPEVLAVLPPAMAGTNESLRAQLDGLFELISRSVAEFAPSNRALIVESPRIVGARSKLSADYLLEGVLRAETPGIAELSLRLIGPRGRELGKTNLPLPGGDLSRGEIPAAMRILNWLGGHPAPPGDVARDPQIAAWRLTALGHAALRTPARLDRAVKLLENVVEQSPDFAEAWADLAALRRTLYGDFRQPAQLDAAEHAARMALRLDSNLVSAATSLAYIELQRGRLREAGEIARGLHARRPNDAEALRLLAETERRQGRSARAAELFTAALRERPEDWRVHDALAHFHLQTGEAARAVAAFRRVTQLNPQDPRSHSNLGGALFVQGDWRGAELEFRRAIELGGTYEALSNLGTYHFFERRDYAAAADMYRRAAAWNPEDHVIRGNLADALRLLGDAPAAQAAYAEAVTLAQRDLATNPADRTTRAIVAYYLAALGRREESAAELARLGPREGCDAVTLFTGALAHELAGRRDEALIWLGDALSRGHSPEEVRQHPDLADLRRDPRFAGLPSGSLPP